MVASETALHLPSTSSPSFVVPRPRPGPTDVEPHPEDSSRFSLVQLAAIALGGNDEPVARGGPRPQPSGLIDVSYLREALAASTRGPSPATLADPLRRLVPVPGPEPGSRDVPVATRPSSAVMFAVLGALSGIVVMLLVAFAWTPEQFTGRGARAPAVALSLPDDVWDDGVIAASDPIVPWRAALDVAAPPAALDEPVVAPAPTKPRPRSPRTTSSRREPATKPAPSVAAGPTPEPTASGRGLSVDCILDPASCGRGAPGSSTTTPTKPTAQGLPTKLSDTQIRTALASPKSSARTCGEIHGAAAGTKVTVRLSIDGATGRVRSASPQAPHGNALGRCVADALATASFPRFSNEAMGVVYSVRM